MKILLIRPKLYSLIHQSRDTEKISEENVRQIEDGRQLESDRNDGNDRKVEKGRPLTLIVVLGMLICCLAWTLTVWFSGANFTNTFKDEYVKKLDHLFLF